MELKATRALRFLKCIPLKNVISYYEQYKNILHIVIKTETKFTFRRAYVTIIARFWIF